MFNRPNKCSVRKKNKSSNNTNNPSSNKRMKIKEIKKKRKFTACQQRTNIKKRQIVLNSNLL